MYMEPGLVRLQEAWDNELGNNIIKLVVNKSVHAR